MNNIFLEDPVVEIKEVSNETDANNLIKQGWIYLDTCHCSEVDCGNIYSYFKYSLALTKSAKNALSNKSTKTGLKPIPILEEDM